MRNATLTNRNRNKAFNLRVRKGVEVEKGKLEEKKRIKRRKRYEEGRGTARTQFSFQASYNHQKAVECSMTLLQEKDLHWRSR